jgi:CRISPR/Cas system endoribonuclease Cas6 (RAMP superfamily)
MQYQDNSLHAALEWLTKNADKIIKITKSFINLVFILLSPLIIVCPKKQNENFQKKDIKKDAPKGTSFY